MSTRKQKYHRYTKKANKALLGLLTDTRVSTHTSKLMGAFHRAARQIEDFSFTNGDTERLLLTLLYLRDRPSICELGVLKGFSNKGILTDYYTKEEKMNDIIVK